MKDSIIALFALLWSLLNILYAVASGAAFYKAVTNEKYRKWSWWLLPFAFLHTVFALFLLFVYIFNL